MLKLFVANLPPDTNEKEFTEMFTAFGRVRALKLSTDIFSGKCRGFGSLEMEGHEARAAIAGLNGKELRGKPLRVGEERADARGGKGRRRH
jgi:RNA recognition motif-containing protein